MNKDELTKIISAHRLWAQSKGGSRADLCDANLRGADLSRAYLSDANLRGADLSGADLRGAYLRGADLRDANLRGADLRGADLSGAYLSRAYLSGADLSRADLSGAYLSRADLRDAKISWLSHDLLSEIIIQNADDNIGLLLFASAISAGARNVWCCGWYLSDDAPKIILDNRNQALAILLRYIQHNDKLPKEFEAWIGVRDGSEDDAKEEVE